MLKPGISQTTRSLKIWRACRAYSESSKPVAIKRPTVKYALLTNRALIEVGPNPEDVRTFLHGLVTADIKNTWTPSSSYYTAFLNASGRVLDDVFIYPPLHKIGATIAGLPPAHKIPHQYTIEVDQSRAAALKAHLKKHRLRRKIWFRVLSPEEGQVYGLWTEEGVDPQIALKPYLEPEGFWKLDQRSGMGCRCILKSKEAMEAAFGPPNATLEDYKIHRMLHGIPEGPLEIIPEKALPQESNIDLFGGIDFRKGCYLGQELTIRTHHTGVVRKRIVPVQLYDDAPKPTPDEVPRYDPGSLLPLPPAGSKISASTTSTSAKPRTGVWLDGVGNVGLALCSLQKMTDIKTGPQSEPPDADQLLKDSHQEEFEAKWEGQDEDTSIQSVKVRAFVPPWMRLGIEQRVDPPKKRR